MPTIRVLQSILRNARIGPPALVINDLQRARPTAPTAPTIAYSHLLFREFTDRARLCISSRFTFSRSHVFGPSLSGSLHAVLRSGESETVFLLYERQKHINRAKIERVGLRVEKWVAQLSEHTTCAPDAAMRLPT